MAEARGRQVARTRRASRHLRIQRSEDPIEIAAAEGIIRAANDQKVCCSLMSSSLEGPGVQRSGRPLTTRGTAVTICHVSDVTGPIWSAQR